jgi:serine/threonine-protein kinase SRK2
MEYASKGDLFNYVNCHSAGLPESQARWLFQQIIFGLDFAHRLGVSNRDIKLENILLCGKKKLLAKLSDFGFSKDESHSAPKTRLGTMLYIAPEVISENGLSYDAKKVDIWSAGVVLYCLLIGKHPFKVSSTEGPKGGKLTSREIIHLMIQKITSGDFIVPDDISPHCGTLIKGMLREDPQERYSIADIFANPWFQEDLKPGLLAYNESLVKSLTESPPVNEESIATIRQILRNGGINVE